MSVPALFLTSVPLVLVFKPAKNVVLPAPPMVNDLPAPVMAAVSVVNTPLVVSMVALPVKVVVPLKVIAGEPPLTLLPLPMVKV